MNYIILDEETMKAYRCLNVQEVMNLFQQQEEPRKVQNALRANFRKLVQYPDADRLMMRLHQLIDGR